MPVYLIWRLSYKDRHAPTNELKLVQFKNKNMENNQQMGKTER